MSEKLEYLKKLELQVEEAQAVLDRLKAEREQARQAAQHEEIERLEEHLADARVRLTDLSKLTEEAWQDFKTIVEEVLHKLQESLSSLVKH